MIDSRCEEVLLSDSRCLFLIYVERVVKKVDVEGTVGRVYRVYTKTMRDVKKKRKDKEEVGEIFDDEEEDRPIKGHFVHHHQ